MGQFVGFLMTASVDKILSYLRTIAKTSREQGELFEQAEKSLPLVHCRTCRDSRCREGGRK
ncbi:MAG TPA: hypothetical protein DEA61_02785 [Caldanaerobacter subterraneus]|uniref:Uncharacterized protein n=1 Tax=Caldanaerobacter subterraneus TaxID=911092 RepID=A0A357VKJ0_9THEO|nr:hypothetical protein [Caldanaerobacter subterraneus]